jgi:hypothetical protein
LESVTIKGRFPVLDTLNVAACGLGFLDGSTLLKVKLFGLTKSPLKTFVGLAAGSARFEELSAHTPRPRVAAAIAPPLC